MLEFSVQVDVALEDVLERAQHPLEAVAVHGHADAVRLGDDAGGAGLVPEERQLAEVAADIVLADALRCLTSVEDLRGIGLALLEEVEQAALFALRDDGVARRVLDLFERLSDL